MTHWSRAMASMRACTACKWATKRLVRLQRLCAPHASRLNARLEDAYAWAQDAWRRYGAWVAEHEVMRLDRAYQPAVIELQETPASPTARLFLKGTIALVVLALLWSIFGKIDIVASGQGKIIPTGRVKVIQPLEAGVIKAIHAEDGQKVKQGDVLVELDLTQTEADTERLGGERLTREADVSRLRALLDGKPMPNFANLSPDLVAVQENLFSQVSDKHTAEIAALEDELTQRESEHIDARQQVNRLVTTVKLMADRADRIQKLVAEGFYARNRFALDETERLRLARELSSQRERMIQSAAGVSGTKQKIAAAEAEFRRTLLSDLADKEDRRLLVTKELEKAEQRNRQHTLLAPIDGTVQEVKIHTLGGVVTPAQELMKVVPFEDALEAEVLIPNKDIGFIKPGQPVAIKLEAFPFTKYGLINGDVKSVSLDAIPDEKLGLVYAARIGMKQGTIRVADKDVVLGPGLALSAEVKTGTRRIIEYFLSPLMEYADEAIRER
jgi:hemolysin D